MALYIDVERLGSKTLKAAINTREVFSMAVETARRSASLTNTSVRKVFYKQIYFTGIQALMPVSIIGALIGIVIITQVTNIIGTNPVLIGRVLVWTVVRELGPLLAAIIIIARSSSAVASELGSMRVNKEVDSLMVMGIEPLDYLVVPRVLGTSISVVILTFYFQAMAIGGGMLISSIIVNVPIFSQIKSIFSALGVFEIFISILKSLVFGLIIATSSCYHGLGVRESITEIPRATSSAVMQSLSLIFVSNVLITLVSYL
jgi:phospholipid/cholesterol/gamma-HCH transport system permease protein